MAFQALCHLVTGVLSESADWLVDENSATYFRGSSRVRSVLVVKVKPPHHLSFNCFSIFEVIIWIILEPLLVLF